MPLEGGLPAPCKNLFALEPEDGVEGGRVADHGVLGAPDDAEAR